MHGSLRDTAALALRRARARITHATIGLRERAGGTSSHALAAGGVKVLAGALEVAAGPLASTAIAAAGDVGVLAIATRAVRRSAPTHAHPELRRVFDVVIADLARDRLSPHLAAGWRAACGTAATASAGRPLAVAIARVALRQIGEHVTTRTLRRTGLKKLLWLGPALSLAALPRDVRRVVELVERAEQAALDAAAAAQR